MSAIDAHLSGLNQGKDLAKQTAWCPACGQRLSNKQSLVVEYWRADQVIYDCFCSECGWDGEIITGSRVVISEFEE